MGYYVPTDPENFTKSSTFERTHISSKMESREGMGAGGGIDLPTGVMSRGHAVQCIILMIMLHYFISIISLH